VQAELQRILASPAFLRSERLARFLRYVVEQTLAGEGEAIKEYSIGVSVYDRPDFDPRIDSSVRVDARRLRAKLEEYYEGPGANAPLRIELPKGTYVPVFVLRGEQQAPVSARPRRGKFQRPLVFLAVLAVLIVGFVWSRRLWTSESAGTGVHAVHSLAVLPFANLTGKPEYEAFCDGLAEEIIDRLARQRGIRVVSRSSAFAYKGKQVDVRTVARDLQVDSVVEGSVRSGGDTLRITVQLVRGADGSQVWSESADLTFGDELQVQTSVGRIIESLLSRNLPGGPARSAKLSPEDQKWDNLVQQAAVLAQRRMPESLELAIDYAGQAAGARPDWARAWAVMADASYSLADFQRGEAARKAVENASEYAKKANKLDPELPGPLITLGMIDLHIERNWDRARDLLRRAVAASPSHAVANARFALLLSLTGDHDRAREYAQRAEMLAPTSVRVLATAGDLSYFARRYEDAIAGLRKALAIDPGYSIAHITITRSLELLGRREEALKELDLLTEADRKKPEFAALIAWLLARASNKEKAREWMGSAAGASSISLAGAWSALGDRERALNALEQGVTDRDPSVVYLKVSPSVDPLRNDPRLDAICKRVGLSGCLYSPPAGV
jgi:TolB-like protein/Tfp pilus assembly protein PilF